MTFTIHEWHFVVCCMLSCHYISANPFMIEMFGYRSLEALEMVAYQQLINEWKVMLFYVEIIKCVMIEFQLYMKSHQTDVRTMIK